MNGERIISAGDAIAVGRFRPEGVAGYHAKSMPDAPMRETRAQALADEMAWLERSGE